MRFLFTTLLIILLAYTISAQTRIGQYTLNGESQVNNFGGGYFITPRLLARFYYGGSGSTLLPGLRYYLNDGKNWLPYLEASVPLSVRQGTDLLSGLELNAGLERELVGSVLLNIYAYGSRDWNADRDAFGIRGELNALLGSTAGKSAVERKLKARALSLGNRLVNAGGSYGEAMHSFAISINPDLGIMLSNHDYLKVGPLIRYSTTEQEVTQPVRQETVQTNFVTARIDLAYRRYLFTDALFNPYAEAFIGYRVRFGAVTRNGDRAKSTSNRTNYGFKLGCTTFIASAVSLDVDLEIDRVITDINSRTFVYLASGLSFWLN